jgi:hypothetical protein
MEAVLRKKGGSSASVSEDYGQLPLTVKQDCSIKNRAIAVNNFINDFNIPVGVHAFQSFPFWIRLTPE